MKRVRLHIRSTTIINLVMEVVPIDTKFPLKIPGKSCFLPSISANMQPTDHISTAVE